MNRARPTPADRMHELAPRYEGHHYTLARAELPPETYRPLRHGARGFVASSALEIGGIVRATATRVKEPQVGIGAAGYDQASERGYFA